MTDASGSTTRCPALAKHGASLAGAVVWVVSLLVLRPSPLDIIWAKFLLLLAPLVLLPLGLRLARSACSATDDRLDRPWRTVTLAQPPTALLLCGAFLLPQGFAAAALAIPWLATTGLIALLGLARVGRHALGPCMRSVSMRAWSTSPSAASGPCWIGWACARSSSSRSSSC